MILFWLSTSILLLVSIIVILKKLLAKNNSKLTHEEDNRILYQQKLLEIDKDIENNSITNKQAENIKAELKDLFVEQNNNSSDLSSNFYHSSENSKRNISIILVLIIPFFVVSIYNIIGDSDSIQKLAIKSDIDNLQNNSDQLASLDEMLNRVEKRLLDNPDSIEDWQMLANSYVVLKRYPEAIRAYENLYRLTGDDPALLLRYADTLAIANSGIFAGKPKQMIKKALQLEPENTMGLWLAGLVAYEEREIEAAINYWKKVLPKLEEGSEEQKNIKKYIKFASENNNIPVEANKLQPQNQNIYKLKLKIELSDDFDDVDKNNAVFIYAKSKDAQNNVPIIVLRKKVSDLPLTIELDDSMSMLPSNKLSNYESVKVIARISKSGDAKSKIGDPIGIIESISTTSKKITKLMINKKVE